jgi:hypothetical protein
MRRRGLAGGLAGLIVGALIAACTSARSGSPPAPSPTGVRDPFVGLTYRLELPSGWIVLGSASYETAIDLGADVATWLETLDLDGPNAFRAYEPEPAGAGLRLAINPSSTWSSGASTPYTDAAAIAAMPGVTGAPIGDMVGVGAAAKATRFRWTQAIDWGGGTVSTRTCLSYFVMTEYDPVNVLFTYPADTDRQAVVDAMIATFEVLASPVVSLPPGATPSPTPTPYDKYASNEPEPAPREHGAPALEALLPDSVDGALLAKESRTGVGMGLTPADSLLAPFGKAPADLATATAASTAPPMLIVMIIRLDGVAGRDLLTVMLEDIPADEMSAVVLNDQPVTYVMHGAWPVWYWAAGESVFGVAATSQEVVARVMNLVE